MSGFLYRGRHLTEGGPIRPNSVGAMSDTSCGETDKGPPLQTHSLREFEQHLNDLKKENFSLKLRIYFLEERIQQKYEESSDDVHRRNIELKVEVESLKQELQEKQQILDAAVLTAEGLSNQNEAQLQQRFEERQTEISHIQELLEAKVQSLQEEAQLARGEAEKMSSFVDSSSQRCLALEREMAEKMEECREALGPQQHKVLAEKDRLIEKLTKERSSLCDLVAELETKVQDLSSSFQKKERDADLLQDERQQENNRIQQEMQKLVDEQQAQLSQYENAAGQCVGELQKAQLQVHSLQAKIRESETRNQKLQVRLSEMEMELRSAREEAQRQERNILNLTDTVSTREAEAVELYRVIEEQGTMLASLKELANRNQLQQLQMSGAETMRGQGEVLSLQASLFQVQLELQAGQRAQRQATRREEDLGRALERLEKDLQGALQHRRDTERHNQDLQLALETARSTLQERGERLREQEGEKQGEVEDREKTIKELRSLLQTKEQVAQEYSELLEQQQGPGEKRDAMLQRLRDRIKERDRALEHAVDEKFRSVEEKEGETRRLQLLVREKERDLERQRCVLSNNEETITSMEALLRGKGLELEQVCGAWKAAQRHHQEAEERQRRALTERDALIGQLQAALHTRTTEAQELHSSLMARLPPGPNDLLEELRARLQLKERLFQEVLSDRARQAQEHQAEVQELLHTVTARDQHIQDASSRLGEVMSEQASRLQELRRQLSSTSQSPAHSPSTLDPGSASAAGLELQTLQEELRLAMRREREAQEESYRQAARLETLARTIRVNEGIIEDYQKQLADPSALPLVERLTRELQEWRESRVVQDPGRGAAIARDRPANRQAEYGGGHQRSMGRYL